jgi:hypothetical protein
MLLNILKLKREQKLELGIVEGFSESKAPAKILTLSARSPTARAGGSSPELSHREEKVIKF